MNLKRFISYMLLSVFFVLGLNAEPVTPDGAKKVAGRFLSLYGPEQQFSVGEAIGYALSDEGQIGYYYVRLNPTGWIMVSGDDVLKPVIGYSFENELVPRAELGEVADKWFKNIELQIKESLDRDDLEKNKEWDQLFRESYTKAARGTAVEPFIKVEWNQGSGWNRFCPEDADGPGGHAYVGCVAVSMAQAMSVYQYPVQPEGEHGYTHDKYGYLYVNYDAAAPYDWANMSKTSSDDENARLLYHLAVAVNMDFGADASGAFTSTSANVLKKYFGYAQSTAYKSRSGFSDEAWHEMIIGELVQGHPVIYSGNGDDGQAGHAFNIDGVGADGTYFHLNWGWSGSANGYYTLDNLTPNGGNYSFNSGAIFGFRPPEAGPYDITLSNSTVYEKQPAGTFVGMVDVADEDENNTYTFVLKGKYNLINHEYGPARFYIENDSLKTLEEFDYDVSATEFLLIEVTDAGGKSLSREFNIGIEEFFFGPTDITLTENKVEEGKNPGYFVGVFEVEDDIENNDYTYSCVGGYDIGSLISQDCFTVRNDSLFTNLMFEKDDGLFYYLSISLEDGYGHSLSKVFDIEIVDNISGGTGINERLTGDLKLYPNPASGIVTVEFTDNSTGGEVMINVFNMLGQVCINCALIPGEQMDVSELNNGAYMVVIRKGDAIFRQKMLISK